MIIVLRSKMQKQTTANLISAGILNQEEADVYYELLSAMTVEEVVAALLESQQLREDCSNPIDCYPIGEICLN